MIATHRVRAALADRATRGVPSAGEVAGGADLLARFRWWGIAWFAAGALVGFGRLGDNSFLTHLATGRLIVDGRLPRTDPYSFTASGEPWVVQSWLASALYGVVEVVGGLGLLRWVLALVAGATLAGIWRLTRPAGAPSVRLVLTAAPLLAGLRWWDERPQMLAFGLLVASLLVVCERRTAWWLAPVFAVWVNVHGSWVVGVAVVSLAAFAAGPAPRSGVVVRSVRGAAPVALAAALGVLAGALASPYGWELVSFPFELVARGDQLSTMGEWRRPELTAPGTLIVLGLAGAAVAASRRRRDLRWLPLVAVCAVLTASAVRNLAPAAIALVPAALGAFDGIGPRPPAAPPWRRLALAAVVVAAIAAVGVAATGPHLDLAPYPVEVVDRLESRGWVATPTVRVAAVDWVGAYLELRYGDDAHVFVDDRAELFGAGVAADLQVLVRGSRDWGAVLDRHDIDVVVWRDGTPLAGELSSDGAWREVERSGGFVAWCRVGALVDC